MALQIHLKELVSVCSQQWETSQNNVVLTKELLY